MNITDAYYSTPSTTRVNPLAHANNQPFVRLPNHRAGRAPFPRFVRLPLRSHTGRSSGTVARAGNRCGAVHLHPSARRVTTPRQHVVRRTESGPFVVLNETMVRVPSTAA